MNIQQIVDTLNQRKTLIAPLSATLEKHLAWVTLWRVVAEQNPSSPRYNARRARAKYEAYRFEMSVDLYHAHLRGNDIKARENSTIVEGGLLDTDEELEQHLIAWQVDTAMLRDRLSISSSMRYPPP